MKRHFFVLITLMILFDFKIQDVKAQNTDSLIQSLISRMTLEEKAALCSGKDTWTTKPIDRLNNPIHLDDRRTARTSEISLFFRI